MTDTEKVLKRRVEREIAARKQAESFLEQKSLDLYRTNEKLRKLNEELEQKVKERTETIIRSELLYKTVVGSLKSAVLLEDETRHIILANENFCEMFAVPLPAEQMVGIDCSQSAEETKVLFHDPVSFVDGVNTLLKNRRPVTDELLYLKDGRVLLRDYIPIFGNEDYMGHLWKYDDVTAEQEVQDLIKDSEEKYRGIIENMDLGIMEVDTNDIITKVYDKFCSMVGYSSQELVGKKAMDLFLPDESFKAVMNEQNANREEGQSGVYEVPLKRKDGVVIWVIISGAPIVDRKGKLIGSVGVHLDVSDKRKTQEILEEARQVAENARMQEKRFLANMSHDIRTPINAIIGLTHLLLDTNPNEEQYQFLNGIKHSSDALLSLVSDVLDISKIEAGEMKMVEKAYSLKALINSVVQPFRVHLKGKPIEINYEIDERIENEVFGDPGFLTQILLNLLGNAEKFTNSGEIKLKVNLLCKLGDFLMTEFQVIDSGIGISSDKVNSIFDSYRQADHTIKSKFGGTGLGLAIVKQLVNIHGGEISVDSEINQGSTFTFTLPLKDTGKIAKEPLAYQEEIEFGPDHKLLVVEDNELNIVYISGLLKKWNVRFIVARSANEASKALAKEAFSLVLMDISLGDGNGFDLTKKVRDDVDNPNFETPILALSASALTDDVLAAKEAGMNDFVPKPFRPGDLHATMQKFLKVEPKTVLTSAGKELDLSFIDKNFNGDKVYAQELINIFLKTVPLDFEKIEELIWNGENENAGKLAHKIKPSFGFLGMNYEMEIMKQLEQHGKAGNAERLKAVLREGKDQILATIESLKKLKI